MESDKKKTIIMAVAALIIVGAALTVYFIARLSVAPPSASPVEPAGTLKMSNAEANDLALARAREWQADAKLARQNSLKDKTDAAGRSDDWELLFVSESAAGRGYSIVIENKEIVSAEEIPYFGEGAELPGDLITADEAIAKVRRIGGYENEPILSVEMIYDQGAKLWFWGVKTARGVVSIKATK